MLTGYRARRPSQYRRHPIDLAVDSMIGGALVAMATALVLGLIVLYLVEI